LRGAAPLFYINAVLGLRHSRHGGGKGVPFIAFPSCFVTSLSRPLIDNLIESQNGGVDERYLVNATMVHIARNLTGYLGAPLPELVADRL
jgi:hypothetical protein